MRGGGGARPGYGSVVDAGAVLLALTPLSELIAFKPTDKAYTEVARIKVADSPTYAYPVVAGNRRKDGDWYSGKPLGDFDYVQFINLDPRGRPREQIARDWIKRLSSAIRKHDRSRMITVGLWPV